MMRFECAACLAYVSVIDQIVENLLLHEGVKEFEKFCFATHELVINSVEAMQTRKAPDDPGNITMDLKISDHELMFSINDKGGGIPIMPEESDEGTETREISLEDRGRGLSLIRLFSDLFVMKAETDGSHTYTITKAI